MQSEKHEDLTTKQADTIECPICFELMTDNIYITLCGHKFCNTCISNLRDKKPCFRCPYCRYKQRVAQIDEHDENETHNNMTTGEISNTSNVDTIYYDTQVDDNSDIDDTNDTDDTDDYEVSYVDFDEENNIDDITENGEQIICPICRDILDERTTDIYTTTCNHKFCRRCILTWIETSKRHTCPYCNYCDGPINGSMLRSMDGLIYKLVSCRNVHDFNGPTWLTDLMNTIDASYGPYRLYPQHREAIMFIKSDYPDKDVIIKSSIESLISRGYAVREGNLIYGCA